jgi:hypothetical protein
LGHGKTNAHNQTLSYRGSRLRNAGQTPELRPKLWLAPPPQISNITGMTADILENELKTLPETERARIIRGALQELSPPTLKALERQLRRFAHPEVPEDVWTGFEEAEDGRGIEIRDEHFERPPI